MIMSGINIPTFGCWEITGRYKDQELSFTVWVTRGSEEEWSPGVDLTLAQAAPRRIHVDDPAAKVANISGTVVLHTIIDTGGQGTGTPVRLRASSSCRGSNRSR
jgi:hypothetical protein